MKFRARLQLLIAGVVAGIASPAYSLDDKAVLKRLDQLEAQRKADQAEIQSLRSKVQQLETQKSGAVTSAEATKLHEEIVKVDQKAASRIESTKKSIDSEREKLKINGYMSVYGVKSTNKAVSLGAGVDNHIGFSSDTIAAIQFDYKMDENFDAVVQFRSEGRNDYDIETPWAFLRYKLTPTTTVRAGRLVAPLYLYADSLDVGYTYPWVRPPIEMYSTIAPQITGIDLNQSFNFGGWNNSLQVVYGDSDRSSGGSDITTDYTAGLALTFNNDAWTFRAAAFRSENFNVSGLNAIGVGSGRLDYYSGAVRYDDGALLVLVEGRKISTGEALESGVADSDGFYTTVGYQIDKFMPYATWAKAYSTHEELSPFLLQESQESVGLGLRYNLTDKVVVKGEVTKYDHFDGTAGVSTMSALPSNPVERAATLQELDDDGATVMSLGVDAIF